MTAVFMYYEGSSRIYYEMVIESINSFLRVNKNSEVVLFTDCEILENLGSRVTILDFPNLILDQVVHNNVWKKRLMKLLATYIVYRDRYLYLDLDTYTKENVEELQDMYLSDKELVCAVFQTGGYKTGEITVPDHFNSGVLLINARKIREKWTLREFIRLLNDTKESYWADEGIFVEIFMKDYYKKLPEAYNVLPENGKFKEPAKIVHFAGLNVNKEDMLNFVDRYHEDK